MAAPPRSLVTPKRNVVAQRARQGKAEASRPLGKWLWENVKSLAGAVVIYLFVKTLFVEAFRIPSGSMIPTLLVGDWLFVNKLAYGPTIPFTNIASAGLHEPQAQRRRRVRLAVSGGRTRGTIPRRRSSSDSSACRATRSTCATACSI